MDNLVLYIYNFILHVSFLTLLPFLAVAAPFVRRLREGFFNYFGLLNPAQRAFLEGTVKAGGRFYMIHGVSVGEIKLAGAVMEEILKRDPSAYFALTSTSPESVATASKIEPAGRAMPLYFPLDIPIFLSFFFKTIKPREIYILEVDLWPNFIIAAAVRGVPVYLLNGRISDKTFNFYSKFPRFARSLFSLPAMFFMQSQADRERAVELGAASKTAVAAGNMKFDTAVSPAAPVKISALKDAIVSSFGSGEYGLVICAGSTHPDEEETILDIVSGACAARGCAGGTLLIIAPRRVERADEIAAMAIKKAGPKNVMKFTGRSGAAQEPACGFAARKDSSLEVLVIGCMGYLSAAYSLSDAAYVGGTLSTADIGGHNIIEPAAFAVPVIFGKNVRNFRDAASALLDSPGVIMAEGRAELKIALESLFEPEKRRELSSAGAITLEIMSRNSNVTKKIFSIIKG
ncbi:MAG TPA: glycosyltransferase N-terminal domain-containing protein [Candidatus Wallbacteria bacterium]|nr:MAG: 3-deoxy-D-manno-octulosonic acid transferase [bacterium ADurb.Bin243]HPG56487.1 glycosyltransferase N-terminal domain-containing protein [Candidatus Wallbacteria bacterium]